MQDWAFLTRLWKERGAHSSVSRIALHCRVAHCLSILCGLEYDVFCAILLHPYLQHHLIKQFVPSLTGLPAVLNQCCTILGVMCLFCQCKVSSVYVPSPIWSSPRLSGSSADTRICVYVCVRARVCVYFSECTFFRKAPGLRGFHLRFI